MQELSSHWVSLVAEVRSAGRGASRSTLNSIADKYCPSLFAAADEFGTATLPSPLRERGLEKLLVEAKAAADLHASRGNASRNGVSNGISDPWNDFGLSRVRNRTWNWGFGLVGAAAAILIAVLAYNTIRKPVIIVEPGPDPRISVPIPKAPPLRPEGPVVNKTPNTELKVAPLSPPKKRMSVAAGPKKEKGVVVQNQPYAGTFGAVMGEPLVYALGSKKGVSTVPGMAISYGSRIETGEMDKLELKFTDGTLIRLGYNTTIVIPKPNELNLSGLVVTGTRPIPRPESISLKSGSIYATVTHLSDDSIFKIETQAATAEVLGTTFSVEVVPHNGSDVYAVASTKLIVKEGIVRFTNLFGRVVATDQTETTATAATAPTPPVRTSTLRLFRPDGTSFAAWYLAGGALGTYVRGLATPAGWLGLNVDDLPIPASVFDAGFSVIGINGQTPSKGVRVSRVDPRFVATSKAFQLGDVVLAIDGKEVATEVAFYAATIPYPGQEVSIEFFRDGVQLSVKILVEQLDKQLTPKLDSGERESVEAATRPLLIGDYKLAIRHLQKLTKRKSAAAFNNLGVVFQVLQRHDDAKRNFQIAVQLSPNVPLYHRNLAEAFRFSSEMTLACSHGRIAADLAPGSAYAQGRHAQDLLFAARFAEALPFARKGVELEPKYSDGWRYVRLILNALKREVEAAEAGEKAIEADPSNSLIYAEMAASIRASGKYKEAVEMSRRAIAIGPIWSGPYNTAASAARSLGDYDFAEKCWKAAVAVDPNNALWKRNLGALYRTANRLKEAESLYFQALKLEPEHEGGYLGLESIYRATNQPDKVIEVLTEAVHNVPTVPELSVLLSTRLVESENHLEAEQVLRRAVRDFPRWQGGYLPLISLLEQQKRIPEANQVITRWISSNPRTALALNNLAWFLAERGERLPFAEQLVKRALSASPPNPTYLDTLGWIQFKKAQHKEARVTFSLATRLAGTKEKAAAEIWAHLGLAEEALGNKVEAIAAFKTAVAMDPKQPIAVEGLKRLGG